MTKTAIGYVRVSTQEQAIGGVSIDAQRALLEAWASAHGYELDGVFIDAGLSGKRADNRPELQRALAAVCKARGVLVVYSLSRLARSTKDAIAISERLHRARADLVSLTEQIDTTTAAGKMVFRMLAVLAEFERDLVSERTRTALAHKRARGERAGNVPFGFRLATDGRTLETDPGEQVALEQVRTLRTSGLTLRAIAHELNARGILTRRGGRWAHQYVAGVLRPTASNVVG